LSGSPDPADAAPRIEQLTARELARFEASTPASRRLTERAGRHLAGSVPSSFQRAQPWPVHLVEGSGARVIDADGAERIDFHNGFGAGVAGHAHPAIAAAVARRARLGTQFGAPSEDAIVVAELLSRRWGVPSWRFANSGTEAAADAIRIARAATGRERVVAVEGAYHGIGVAADAPTVELNDAPGLERRLADLAAEGRPAACLLIEPAMMLGCLLPDPGYLEAVRRVTCDAGALLIFDEAKTGLSIAAGGAVELFGGEPDLVVLAKALGGGLPVGAVGGTEAAMAAVAAGDLVQAGTFNGNPLSMAAARACLEDVLEPAAYGPLSENGERLRRGLEALGADGARNPATGAGVVPIRALGRAARGGFALTDTPPRTARELLAARPPDLERLLWLYAMNRGLYLTPARPMNWTISVAHGPDEVDAYAAVVGELLAELGAGQAPDGRLAASTQSGSGTAS
jgi:glutamate-1-semialdehyde 2,1-aminomutase